MFSCCVIAGLHNTSERSMAWLLVFEGDEIAPHLPTVRIPGSLFAATNHVLVSTLNVRRSEDCESSHPQFVLHDIKSSECQFDDMVCLVSLNILCALT